MPSYVYKYVLDEEIIYIGKTDNIKQRILSHGKNGDNIPECGWPEINCATVYYARLANRVMADVVESELIHKYMPKYNKAKTSEWDGLDFQEPKWILFNKSDVNKEDVGSLKRQLERKSKELEHKEECIKILTKHLQELIDERRNLEKHCKENKCFVREMAIMANRELEMFYEFLQKPALGDGEIDLENIFERYRNGEMVNYVSETFYKNGQLASRKHVYKTASGSLRVSFIQSGEDREMDRTIFDCPKDKERKNKEFLKTISKRGGFLFRKVRMEDVKVSNLQKTMNDLKCYFSDVAL